MMGLDAIALKDDTESAKQGLSKLVSFINPDTETYQTLSPARRTFVFLGSRCTRPLSLRDAQTCSLLRIFKMADRLKREIKKAKRFFNKYLT